MHDKLKTAINVYEESCWLLASALALQAREIGYNKTQQLVPLPNSKVKLFLAVDKVPRVEGLSFDHHAEVISVQRKKYWLNRAKKENWNPLELRKQIRRAAATFGTKSKSINARQYPQLVDTIERELKRMGPEEQARAKQYINAKLN